MYVYKCKLCDGDLEIDENQRTGKCKYCGALQTLPKISSDKKINLLELADRARKANEYDKAAGYYESALLEDSTDPEIYWSILLCVYGVEYVKDPHTKQRVITCNRTQYKSVLANENYLSALQYATEEQKKLYEKEAKQINEIQKNILSISKKEKPYDVFICYKETDEKGRRTKDSVLAQELYFRLKNENLKVFFARITLEDKLGENYEPYIFAALNSAKVMVALATKAENLQSVWVKNEWSRFLALTKEHPEKILIPAYCDFSPYELPEEMALLQAQDMSQLGFLQDLTRGIKKITDDNKVKPIKETVHEKTVIMENNAPTVKEPVNIAPLLKRAYIFLENGAFDKADEYCEKVLDSDPENASAYFCKLLAKEKISDSEKLPESENEWEKTSDFKNALRFADEKLKSKLDGLSQKKKEIKLLRGTEKSYEKALVAMENAKSFSDFDKIVTVFESLGDFKDSKELIEICKLKHQELRNQQEEIKKKQIKIQRDKEISTFSAVIKSYKTSLNLLIDKKSFITEKKVTYLNRIQKHPTVNLKTLYLLTLLLSLVFIASFVILLYIDISFIYSLIIIGMIDILSSISIIIAEKNYYIIYFNENLDETECFTIFLGNFVTFTLFSLLRAIFILFKYKSTTQKYVIQNNLSNFDKEIEQIDKEITLNRKQINILEEYVDKLKNKEIEYNESFICFENILDWVKREAKKN